MVYQKLGPPQQDMTDSPLVYLSMLFALGCMQLLGLGLISEISVRTYFESQDKRVYAVRERLTGTSAPAPGGSETPPSDGHDDPLRAPGSPPRANVGP
jgi:hypothetical protein